MQPSSDNPLCGVENPSRISKGILMANIPSEIHLVERQKRGKNRLHAEESNSHHKFVVYTIFYRARVVWESMVSTLLSFPIFV